MSEEHETVKCTDDKYIEKSVESFCARAGKLENDLQRYGNMICFSQMFVVVLLLIFLNSL